MTISPFKISTIIDEPHSFLNEIIHNNAKKFPTSSEIAINSINTFIELCKNAIISSVDIPKTSKLNTINLMESSLLQYDSIGDEYYVALQKVKTNSNSFNSLSLTHQYTNASLFKNAIVDNGDHLTLEEQDDLLSRKMLIVNWKGKETLVYYYGSEEFLLNSLLDIQGIMSKEESEESHEEYPHYLRTFHAISIKPTPIISSIPSEEEIKRGRELFLQVLPKKLLFSLISNLNSRVNGIISSLLIGYYPLNVKIGSNCSNASELFNILRRIVPRSSKIPITPSYLENICFESRLMQSDSSFSRLLPGLLQKESNHLFVIDELDLKEGDQITEGGLRQFSILQEFLHHQRVSYLIDGLQDVPLATIPMNNPIVIISNGGSIVGGNKINSINIDSDISSFNDEFEECMVEKFINYCRSIVPSVSINDELANYLVENPSMDVFDATLFSEILNLARLVCASYGRMEMKIEDYLEAMEIH